MRSIGCFSPIRRSQRVSSTSCWRRLLYGWSPTQWSNIVANGLMSADARQNPGRPIARWMKYCRARYWSCLCELPPLKSKCSNCYQWRYFSRRQALTWCNFVGNFPVSADGRTSEYSQLLRNITIYRLRERKTAMVRKWFGIFGWWRVNLDTGVICDFWLMVYLNKY